MHVRTYADVIRPTTKARAFFYDTALIVIASCVLSLFNLLRLYIIPGSPVPVTGQTMAVLLIGMLLGSKRAPLAVLLYVGYGVLGLPFYSGGLLFGPTGGYLVGFVIAAAVVGYLAEQGMDRKYYTTIVAMVVGEIILFAFGMIWLSFFVNDSVFIAGLFPFVPGEIIKIILVTGLLPTGWKLIRRLKKDAE